MLNFTAKAIEFENDHLSIYRKILFWSFKYLYNIWYVDLVCFPVVKICCFLTWSSRLLIFISSWTYKSVLGMTLHLQRQMWQKNFSLMFCNTNLFLFWGLFHWHANNAVSVNVRSPFFLVMMFMVQKFLKWSGKREVWNVSLGITCIH